MSQQKYVKLVTAMTTFDDSTPTASQKLAAAKASNHWFWIFLALGIVLLIFFCVI